MTRGARLDTCDKEGSQAIHVAAMLGHTDILAYLIAKGQSVDTKDASGRTPLMLGKHQEEDHSHIVRFLWTQRELEPALSLSSLLHLQ